MPLPLLSYLLTIESCHRKLACQPVKPCLPVLHHSIYDWNYFCYKIWCYSGNITTSQKMNSLLIISPRSITMSCFYKVSAVFTSYATKPLNTLNVKSTLIYYQCAVIMWCCIVYIIVYQLKHCHVRYCQLQLDVIWTPLILFYCTDIVLHHCAFLELRPFHFADTWLYCQAAYSS